MHTVKHDGLAGSLDTALSHAKTSSQAGRCLSCLIQQQLQARSGVEWSAVEQIEVDWSEWSWNGA